MTLVPTAATMYSNNETMTCGLPRKNMTDRQGWAHRVPFAHTRVWRTPKTVNYEYAGQVWKLILTLIYCKHAAKIFVCINAKWWLLIMIVFTHTHTHTHTCTHMCICLLLQPSYEAHAKNGNKKADYQIILITKLKLSYYTPRRHLGKRWYSYYSFSTSALHGCEWSVSRPGCTLALGKELQVLTRQEVV
jgi:hypothetical protein